MELHCIIIVFDGLYIGASEVSVSIHAIGSVHLLLTGDG